MNRILMALLLAVCASATQAQSPPSQIERARYTGLLLAAARGDAAQIKTLVAKGARVDMRDGYERTPLHIATYAKHHDAMRALKEMGADPNALERDRFLSPEEAKAFGIIDNVFEKRAAPETTA